jgi:hypothetical protein
VEDNKLYLDRQFAICTNLRGTGQENVC